MSKYSITVQDWITIALAGISLLFALFSIASSLMKDVKKDKNATFFISKSPNLPFWLAQSKTEPYVQLRPVITITATILVVSLLTMKITYAQTVAPDLKPYYSQIPQQIGTIETIAPEIIPQATCTLSNSIIQQPENLEVYPSDTASFTVAASKAVKSYMWQYCKDGVTWENVSISVFPSAVTDTLVFKAHSAHDGFQYRCIVYFEDGTTEVSEPAKITVKSY